MTSPKHEERNRTSSQRARLLREVHDAMHYTHFPYKHMCGRGFETLLDLYTETEPNSQLVLYKDIKEDNPKVAWLYSRRCSCGSLIAVTVNEMMHPLLLAELAQHLKDFATAHGQDLQAVCHTFTEQLLDHHVTHGQITLAARDEEAKKKKH